MKVGLLSNPDRIVCLREAEARRAEATVIEIKAALSILWIRAFGHFVDSVEKVKEIRYGSYHPTIAFTHLDKWIGPNKGLKIRHDSLVQNTCFLLHFLFFSFTLKTFKI